MAELLTKILIALVWVVCVGVLISILWNLTLAPMFMVVPEISVWTGCGLYILSNILFKNPGSLATKLK